MEDPFRRIGAEPGLRLIETLAWDGRQVVGEARHLARLARSAARLGWGFDPAAARSLLLAGRGAPARLRLTLDATGTLALDAGHLPAPVTEWTVALAPERVTSGDPWLQVKSTHRPLHDRIRAQLPAGLGEALLANERDEVAEGTITTVFFDRGQGWRTPPLTAGALPGILREQLLEQGVAREEPLPVRDLGEVRLAVGNALRGLVRARLVAWPEAAGERVG